MYLNPCAVFPVGTENYKKVVWTMIASNVAFIKFYSQKLLSIVIFVHFSLKIYHALNFSPCVEFSHPSAKFKFTAWTEIQLREQKWTVSCICEVKVLKIGVLKVFIPSKSDHSCFFRPNFECVPSPVRSTRFFIISGLAVFKS